MKKKKLTAKEERFCQLYSVLGHPLEAARAAGYPSDRALERSGSLLAKKEVRHRLDQLQKRNNGAAMVGWKRLAFSPINDIVRLVADDQLPSPEELAHMDLFSVSSIKKNKDGGLTIELYDRMEALDRLFKEESEGKNEAKLSVYDAILYSAAEDAGVLGREGAEH